MKVTFGALVISAGVCGILSFSFLATSLGTDYWYIIEMNPMNMTDTEDMSSHSGLWRINQGRLQQLQPITLIIYTIQVVCSNKIKKKPVTILLKSRREDAG